MFDDAKNYEAAMPSYVKLNSTQTGIIISSRLAIESFGIRSRPEFSGEENDEFNIQGVNPVGPEIKIGAILRKRFVDGSGSVDAMIEDLRSVLWMFESVRHSYKGNTVSYEERLDYFQKELPLLVTQEKKINAAIQEWNQYINSRKWGKMLFPDYNLEFKLISPREVGIRKINLYMAELRSVIGTRGDKDSTTPDGEEDDFDRKRKASDFVPAEK